MVPDALTPSWKPAPAARLRIGLTGGIGSGKSTVAACWAREGATVVDTDLIARQLTLPGGVAIEPIRATFGPAFIDEAGALDRAAMRELAFRDAGAKRRLEAILHPLIGLETERQFDTARSDVVIFDVPLLVESGGRWRAKVDRVMVVDCREATQIDRVMRRSGWTREAVEAVIAQQATRQQRRACADAVVANDALTLDDLGRAVHAVALRWRRQSP